MLIFAILLYISTSKRQLKWEKNYERCERMCSILKKSSLLKQWKSKKQFQPFEEQPVLFTHTRHVFLDLFATDREKSISKGSS